MILNPKIITTYDSGITTGQAETSPVRHFLNNNRFAKHISLWEGALVTLTSLNHLYLRWGEFAGVRQELADVAHVMQHTLVIGLLSGSITAAAFASYDFLDTKITDSYVDHHAKAIAENNNPKASQKEIDSEALSIKAAITESLPPSVFQKFRPTIIKRIAWAYREAKMTGADFLGTYPATLEALAILDNVNSSCPDYKERRVAAQGDVHADSAQYRANMRQAGVIDESGNVIGDSIQVGDVIDRGKEPLGTHNFRRAMQAQALEKGFIHVHFPGNHELELMRGTYVAVDGIQQILRGLVSTGRREEATVINNTFSNLGEESIDDAISNAEYYIRGLGLAESELNNFLEALASIRNTDYGRIVQDYRDDILAGRVQAAYVIGNDIATHAGMVKPAMYERLRREMSQLNPNVPDISDSKTSEEHPYHELAEYLNYLLIKAVLTNDYSHPIFNPSPSRGAAVAAPGIFWADAVDEVAKNPVWGLNQIIGHTMFTGEKLDCYRDGIIPEDFFVASADEIGEDIPEGKSKGIWKGLKKAGLLSETGQLNREISIDNLRNQLMNGRTHDQLADWEVHVLRKLEGVLYFLKHVTILDTALSSVYDGVTKKPNGSPSFTVFDGPKGKVEMHMAAQNNMQRVYQLTQDQNWQVDWTEPVEDTGLAEELYGKRAPQAVDTAPVSEKDAEAADASALQNMRPIVPKAKITAERTMIGEAEIHANPFRDSEPVTYTRLQELGLGSHKKIIVGDIAFHVSVPFEVADGRHAIVAYFKNSEGEYVARPLYFSNSQTAWRFNSHHMGGMQWIGKGHGEESTTLALLIQKPLWQYFTDMTNENEVIQLSEESPVNFFLSLTRDVFKAAEAGEEVTMLATVQKQPIRPEGYWGHEDDGEGERLLGHPAEIGFQDPGDNPDFTQVLDAYTFEHPTYGQVTAELFNSNNERFSFLFIRDQLNRVGISVVEDNQSEVALNLGLKEQWVDVGALTTPVMEYSDQLKGTDDNYYGNNEITRGHYVDAYEHFLSKIPLIQEYSRDIGHE